MGWSLPPLVIFGTSVIAAAKGVVAVASLLRLGQTGAGRDGGTDAERLCLAPARPPALLPAQPGCGKRWRHAEDPLPARTCLRSDPGRFLELCHPRGQGRPLWGVLASAWGLAWVSSGASAGGWQVARGLALAPGYAIVFLALETMPSSSSSWGQAQQLALGLGWLLAAAGSSVRGGPALPGR